MLIRVERYRSEGKPDGGVGIEAARVDYSEEHSWYSGRAGKGLVGTSTTTRYPETKSLDLRMSVKRTGYRY
jgi:hypothetical protein